MSVWSFLLHSGTTMFNVARRQESTFEKIGERHLYVLTSKHDVFRALAPPSHCLLGWMSQVGYLVARRLGFSSLRGHRISVSQHRYFTASRARI